MRRAGFICEVKSHWGSRRSLKFVHRSEGVWYKNTLRRRTMNLSHICEKMMWQKMRWEERVMGVGDKKTGDSREASSGKTEKTERSFLHLRRPPTQLTFFSADHLNTVFTVRCVSGRESHLPLPVQIHP